MEPSIERGSSQWQNAAIHNTDINTFHFKFKLMMQLSVSGKGGSTNQSLGAFRNSEENTCFHLNNFSNAPVRDVYKLRIMVSILNVVLRFCDQGEGGRTSRG